MFLIVTAVSAVGLAGICALVPSECDSAATTDLRRSLRPFVYPRLWPAPAARAIGFGGLRASFTYIEPLLTIM